MAKSAQKAAKTVHQESIKTIVMLKDAIERQEEDIQRYSTWPDLQLDPRMPDQPAKSESESKKVQVLIISALMT